MSKFIIEKVITEMTSYHQCSVYHLFNFKWTYIIKKMENSHETVIDILFGRIPL